MTTDLDIQLTATSDCPLVGVVMGSDSDWPTMEPAVAALAEFAIGCEVGVVSAHRMPEDMVAYGRSASERGLRVIIAGAGGAAHLPGMLAARILGAGEGSWCEGLRAQMRDFQKDLRDVASAKGAALAKRVAEDY